MKVLLTLLFSSVSCICISQANLSEENAKKIIKEFFEGFHSADTVKMKTFMVTDMKMQTGYVDQLNNATVAYSTGEDFLKSVAAKEKNTTWEERILDVRLETDGTVANIWTPYEFYVNGKFSHCGANSFTLVYIEESWKILNI